MANTEELLAMLEQVRGLDPDFELFGASTHNYTLNPTLSEAEVAAFERENKVTLPRDYRDFLLKAGNGGAGPVYGLHELAPWHCEGFSEVTSVVTTKDGQRFEAGTGPRAELERLSDPARPYPFTAPWRAPEPGESLPIPEGSHPFDGCLYLADIGCGYYYFLVVTGTAAGQVWVDYTAGDGEVSKAADNFNDWYQNWLEENMMTAAVNIASNTLWFNPGEDPRPEVVDVLAVQERVAKQYPEWAGQYYIRGVLLMYNREVDAAIETLNQAIQAIPDDLRPRVMLAQLFYLIGNTEEVLAVADAALALGGYEVESQGRLHWLRARTLQALGQHDAAIEAAAQARDLSFYVFYVQIDFAVFAIRSGQPARAEAALEEYIQQAHEDQSEVDFRNQVYQVMVEACTAWDLPDAAADYQRRLVN